MKQNKLNLLLAAGLILMAATARIVNHEMHLYNLAPIGALGLFGGAVIQKKSFAFLLPILALFIGDLYIQLYPSSPGMRGFYGMEQFFVYGAMLLVTVLGTQMKQINTKNVLGFTLGGSVLFFIVSNLGAYFSGMYGTGWQAFSTTYIMAIPFFKNTLAGDLIGSVLLFGGYSLLQQAWSKHLQKA
ncbi:MAG: hypothetical protein JST52_08920 [Bacteroidetes bacterium]|nr:hypothetical protein [Bacteroidota bacterium]MBS1741257.1 hypothetical protein [Bacteroidota bacterium]